MFLLLPPIKSSYIIDSVKRITTSPYVPYIEYASFTLIFLSCVFVSVYGIHYTTPSLTILLIVVLDRHLAGFIEFYRRSPEPEAMTVLGKMVYNYIMTFVKYEERNPHVVDAGIVAVSCLAAWLISYLLNSILYLGLAVIGFYVYEEFINTKTVQEDNAVAKFLLFVVLMVLLFLLMRKVMMYVFAGFFGTMGPYVSVTGVEAFFKTNWGFANIRENLPKMAETDKVVPHYLLFLVVCGICVLYQCSCLLRGKC